MWNKKLCFGLNPDCEMPYNKQLELLKKTGFDGFFVLWTPDINIKEIVDVAEKLDLEFQSIHAPWVKSPDMWHDDELKGNVAIEELCRCIDACVEGKSPILVMHAFCGFDEHEPTRIGLERFGKVVDYATQKHIKIAFENTEGEEYLNSLMDYFADNDTVGFCWDTGHEMCYNHSQKLLDKWGSRLLCTHLNDNLGISDYNGKITWLDDLHLLPFDGVADWNSIVSQLHRCKFDAPLTFELNTKSKPNRHDNDVYNQMPFDLYLVEAYKRACRVATILIRLENS